jgi:hypothetical protein
MQAPALTIGGIPSPSDLVLTPTYDSPGLTDPFNNDVYTSVDLTGGASSYDELVG